CGLRGLKDLWSLMKRAPSNPDLQVWVAHRFFDFMDGGNLERLVAAGFDEPGDAHWKYDY
ncbi:hypothetical protein CMI48_02165, partial [Candidatus Pacearchaeota archaeon]|nr:hypothetical protein [Candidatus Pacearchaeota archaeon]